MKYLGTIADHPTPKSTTNNLGYTQNSRDYKGVEIVVYETKNITTQAPPQLRKTSKTFDARGNGDGDTCCTITGDHENRITDYTALVLEDRSNKNMYVVRRLTPTECSRLQGFPDSWVHINEQTVNGKKIKPTDTAKYKALGNSIALPQWWWLVNRLHKVLPDGATLGSLFDGISGFPLVWENTYGPHTAKWSSEIEPFCIAVCKQHFGDEEKGIVGDIYDDNV